MITSNANPQIKAVRKLRDRKERQLTGMFLAEGLRICGEAFDRDWDIHHLIVAPELLTSTFGKSLAQDFRSRGGDLIEVSASVFQSIASKENPQGIAAVIQQRWQTLNDLGMLQKVWVALEAIADPGNLGTIMRTLDAVGGQGVILLDNSTDPYDLAAIRASMGALFSLHLIRTKTEQFVDWFSSNKAVVIGTSDKAQLDYHHVRYPHNMILLMGSERQGLSPLLASSSDEMVRIPMVGRSDSLNIAVATSVILYEIYNQHRDQVADSI